MGSFKECVELIFRKLGVVPDAKYIGDLERLNTACSEWWQQRGPLYKKRITLELPDLLAGTVIIGNLDRAIELGICLDEGAKDFVTWIDARTNQTGTILMLQVCCLVNEAVENARKAQ